MNDFPWVGRLLQFSDSAFPTGGYAHSAGFEEMVRLGIVTDEPGTARHLAEHVWPMLIHFELPVVRLAQEAAQRHDLPGLLALDEIVDAAKGTRELREASRAMGRRRLHTFRETAPSPLLDQLAHAIDEDFAQGHHPIIFGVGLAGCPTQPLLTAWAYQTIHALCLAAPKLLRIGQDGVQRLLAGALRQSANAVEVSRTVPLDELGWFDPALEIASMQHEIAHERLFIS